MDTSINNISFRKSIVLFQVTHQQTNLAHSADNFIDTNLLFIKQWRLHLT